MMWASMFREELPWLYELTVELYRAIRSEDARRIGCIRRDLRAAIEMARRGPFMEAFLGRDDETYIMVRHCVDMLDRVLDGPDVPGNSPKISGSKKLPQKK